MPSFMQESFFLRMLFIWVICPYENSYAKKMMIKLFSSIQNSFIYESLENYLNKKPYFVHSQSFAGMRKFLKHIDKIADGINKFIVKTAENSGIVTIVLSAKNNPLKAIIGLTLLAFGFFLFDLKAVAIVILLVVVACVVLSDYQVTTYALACYPFLDYGVRLVVPAFGGIWDELFLVAMIAVWAYKYACYRKEDNFKQTPLDLPIWLFLCAMLLVLIINSSNFGISIDGFRAVVQYIFWFFLVVQLLKDKQGAKNLCLAFLFITSLMALHGVYQYIIGVEMPSYWVDNKEAGVRTRVFSILTSPNILGSLMTLSLPLCLAFAGISKTLKEKLMFYFFASMMTATLVFTFSRGAWIGFAAAVCIYVFFKDKKLFIPVILIGILIVFLVPSISDRILYMLSPEYIESSLRAGRLIRWITGLEILSESPVFGVGLGQFGGAVAMNNNTAYLLGGKYEATYYMDNYYLKTAVESGLFGFFFFVMLMYQIIINGIRTIRITEDRESREIETGIIAGLFGVIIHNFVENVFEVPMMTTCFWLLVAVLMHFWYINYYKDENNKKQLL